MIKIKLARLGKKHQPTYRIVVTQAKSKISGRKIQVIGSYNPNFKPPLVNLNYNRYLDWIKKGAQPTATVAEIVKSFTNRHKKIKAK